MSHIAEQLREAAAPNTGTPCIVARFIAEHLDDEDRDVLDRMLQRPRTGRIVHQVLTANGLDASASSVQNHISGRCACPKENTPS